MCNFVSVFFISAFLVGCKAEPPQVVDSIPRLVTKKTPFFKVVCYQDGSIKLNNRRYPSLASFEAAYIQETRSNSVVWISGEGSKPGSKAPDPDKRDKTRKEFQDLYYFLYLHSKPGIEVRMSGSADFSDLIEDQKNLKTLIDKVNKNPQLIK
jgi:hypothetical protein